MIDTRNSKDRYPDDTYLQTSEEDDARLQPDPQLALSKGKASRTQIILVMLAAAVIAGLVLYGVSQSPEGSQTASSPSPAQTTGAAPSGNESSQPQQTISPQAPANEPEKPSGAAR